MPVKWSAVLRNALLDTWESAIGASAIIRVYTLAPPADVAAAETGVLLAEFILAADWAAAAAGGVKALSGVPLETVGVAAGTAGHYTIYASNGTTRHEQGTITVTGGGGDMTIDNAVIAIGQTVKITSFQKTAPGA
jgi:hypothetical protein